MKAYSPKNIAMKVSIFRFVFVVLIITPRFVEARDALPLLPKGYIIVPSSISPDGRFGISAFDNLSNPLPDHIDNNKLIDLITGSVICEIPDCAITRQNRGGILPARWSSDGSFLLWEVEGRWSPDALYLIRLKNNKVNWRLDLLKTAQRAILNRTRSAEPLKYAAAKKRNKGDGSAFPDGYTVNVRVEGDKPRGGGLEAVKGMPISLPFKVRAELTSNPKDIEGFGDAQLDAELDGIMEKTGRFMVMGFQVHNQPYPHALSDSWLGMTDPAAAENAPINYGDDVSLKGSVCLSKETGGQTSYLLILKKPISIPASKDEPAMTNVSKINLLDFAKWSVPEKVANGGVLENCEIYGVLGYAATKDQIPPVTLKTTGYGY